MAKKQREIAGTESKLDPVLVDLAESYRELRDQRMELAEKEEAARALLQQKLLELGMPPDITKLDEIVVARYDDGNKTQEVYWAPARVKVRTAKDAGGDV